MSNILLEAIKYIESDYKYYVRCRKHEKQQITECILQILHKQIPIPVPTEYFIEGKCYNCHNLNEKDNYCSKCGQRIK